MKQIFRYSCIALLATATFSSCKKEEIKDIRPSPFSSSKSNLKKEFSKILVKALSENVYLRALIKEEALKQFDNDFDVLYEQIKYQKLANGEIVREVLAKYSTNKARLLEIEEQLPLLTLFVPSLPENSFSAENWNVETQIPQVGTSITETNDVPMFTGEGNEYLLKSNFIPNFPVVVVKECERVKMNKGAENDNVFALNGKQFEFLHKSFDRTKNIDKSVLNRDVKNLDQKIVDAYNIYSTVDGWHRDYIYYGITPTIPNGQFSYDFKETITEVNMVGGPYTSFGDGLVPYNKISDQTGEPQYQTTTNNPNSGWTGGNFEFKVIVLFNAKNGLGTIFETYFPALPSELFALTYNQFFPGYYELQSINTKAMPLDLELFNWDLNQYASTIKIDIEEVDVSETITESETVTTKFATNFAIEGTLLKKIGLKFGASLEQTNSNTFTKTYTLGNDKLGSVIVNFADKVIIDRQRHPLLGWRWKTQNYATGFINLSIEPKRVQ